MFPTPDPGFIPVSEICIVVLILSSLLEANASIAIRISGLILSITPFIIIDDLFVTLDETHLEKAKDLVKELAKNRQIIYFTCHSSRDIR